MASVIYYEHTRSKEDLNDMPLIRIRQPLLSSDELMELVDMNNWSQIHINDPTLFTCRSDAMIHFIQRKIGQDQTPYLLSIPPGLNIPYHQTSAPSNKHILKHFILLQRHCQEDIDGMLVVEDATYDPSVGSMFTINATTSPHTFIRNDTNNDVRYLVFEQVITCSSPKDVIKEIQNENNLIARHITRLNSSYDPKSTRVFSILTSKLHHITTKPQSIPILHSTLRQGLHIELDKLYENYSSQCLTFNCLEQNIPLDDNAPSAFRELHDIVAMRLRVPIHDKYTTLIKASLVKLSKGGLYMRKVDGKEFVLLTNVTNPCYFVTSKHRYEFPVGTSYKVEQTKECIIVHSPIEETYLVAYVYT